MTEIKGVSSLTPQQLGQSFQQAPSEAPTLPAATEITEYYTGFGQDFEKVGVELQTAMTRLQNAEKELAKPPYALPTWASTLATFFPPANLANIVNTIRTATTSPEQMASLRAEATAEKVAAATAVQTAEWKQVIMATLPVFMSDSHYNTNTVADVLNLIPPEFELTDADNAWLSQIFDKLTPLMNVLPEGYEGDILDTQKNILNNILTSPKLEMRGVHSLTIEEIAKAFTFNVAELPAGMTEQDVRDLLSELDLNDEELKTQRQWLADRAAEWEIEAARMGMIKAGTLLADTPELTPLEWAKLTVTQPMMATVELMQKWWDAISRPVIAALIMNLPAPVAGAAAGAPIGAMAGATAGLIVGAVGGPIGMGAGAIIGMIAGMIGGAAWLGLDEADDDKELTKHYEFYRSQGDSAWSSYAQAFNAWEAPWWKKMILDSAYDPLNWIGWGAVSAVGRKLATAALPRGLKWAGTRIGTMMVAFENGYTTGADLIFKGGMQVLAAPIKSAFWLTGAGYVIPKSLFQMSNNFGRQGMMDILAVARQSFPGASLVRGKLVGISTKDFESVLETITRYALKNPTSGDTMARAGTAAMEFTYRNADEATKLLRGLVDDAVWDTPTLAKFNSDLLDAFSGFVELPGVVTHGDRIAAGNILNRFNKLASLSSSEATKLVDELASRIGKFKEGVAKGVIDSVKDMAPGDAIYSVFQRIVDARYENLKSPFTQFMQQAGRSASWHSRTADRILQSARIVAFERKWVMPIAKQQLLFTNFGPYNYLESGMRSGLGGAEFAVPKAYGGVDEALDVMGKLSGCPYEMIMLQRGEKRLVQAMVDPETGKALIFRGGNIPLITRDVVMPEKIPFFGGKKLGMTMTIGDKKYFLGSATDWYDMWSDLSGKQLAYDYQIHFTKALYETPLGKKTIDGINSVLDSNRYMLKDISSVKPYISDTERLLRWKFLDSPEAGRALADVDVLTFNRRMIGMKLNQAADQMYDIHRFSKEFLYDKTLDGSMFAKGYSSIDGTFAATLAGERDMSIVNLSPQIEAMKDQVKWTIENPAKNLDDFMWDMQHLTDDIEAIRLTIHDYRKVTELRKVQMILSEADDFEVGSAKELARYMDGTEGELTKYVKQLLENAKAAGLTDVQIARLSDLTQVSRQELENVLAARTKLSEIESEIAAFHKRNSKLWKTNPDKAAKESKLFWTEGTNSQRFRKAAVWDSFDEAADKLKFSRLEASRNFLMSVDKPAFVPDFVPEVVGELTANHLAYLYGATGDDLYRGLTRVADNTRIMPKKDFIIHTREQASAYATKLGLGKTVDQLGFTDEAIGEVYDQMWRSLGINPSILTPDSPTALQLEELRQEMYRWYASTKIPESDVIKWRKYLNTVADGVGETEAYKGVAGGTPDWWDTKESVMPKTREMHAMAYPTYDQSNIIDETMRAVFPFWNYELFRWKWLPRTFMRTPGIMSGIARYMDYTDSGYVPVPGTDLQLNILRGTVFMGGLRSFYLKDFPEYHDAAPGIEFLDYIGRAGFFPGIHVMLPIVLFGAAGKQPQLGQLAPAWVKTSLSGLRALSPEHIGKVLDIVYPDRFRDYMTMMELGSMGYDADAIWKKKQQGEKITPEEEKLWLQAEAKVDGIKGVLMNQTGLFRIRPQDFLQVRQEMRLAIEEATGVPVATQEWIDKMYPVTGKRFTDYYHLDVLQQALLYQFESYRRYQGITTPLTPSSQQALDIKTSDYYGELAKIYKDARYIGVYDDEGNLVQPSIVDINKQLVDGTIGPSQWLSMRSNILDGLSSAANALGNSPAYKDVPKTFEEKAKLLEEEGVVVSALTPDQELLYYYYELKPEMKYNWESDRIEPDYDTYYAYIDALLGSLSPTFKERLLQRIQMDWTPMERLYWNFSREYGRPYRNLREVVLNQYTPEQVKIIRRFEVARGDEREQILEVMGPDGKLISGYQKMLREARQRLRLLDTTLDAWLYFFGTTDKFMSTEAEEIYNGLKSQYLVPAMTGEVK